MGPCSRILDGTCHLEVLTAPNPHPHLESHTGGVNRGEKYEVGGAFLRIETHIYLAPFLCLGLKTYV